LINDCWNAFQSYRTKLLIGDNQRLEAQTLPGEGYLFSGDNLELF